MCFRGEFRVVSSGSALTNMLHSMHTTTNFRQLCSTHEGRKLLREGNIAANATGREGTEIPVRRLLATRKCSTSPSRANPNGRSRRDGNIFRPFPCSLPREHVPVWFPLHGIPAIFRRTRQPITFSVCSQEFKETACYTSIKPVLRKHTHITV